jgi:hypothetical protein
MPVTLPITYLTYCRDLEQGRLDLSSCRCPRCLGEGLRLTKRRVDRPLLDLIVDGFGFCVGEASTADAGRWPMSALQAPLSPSPL